MADYARWKSVLKKELDPIKVSNGILAAYRSLWKELTGQETFASEWYSTLADRD